jgi:hypothetical protein
MRSWLLFPAVLVVACATSGVGSEMDAAPGDANDRDVTLLPDSNDGLDSRSDAPTTNDAAGDTSSLPEGSSCSSMGTLVTYDFTGQPGNQTSTAATSSMAGITAGAVSRASTITAVAAANSIDGSNWSTAGLDTTRYYTFTLTPISCALDITSLSIDTKSSGTGPTSAAVATSDDNFTATSTFTPAGTLATVPLSVTGSTMPVEIRIYGFDASGTAGTFRIENTLTAVGSLN